MTIKSATMPTNLAKLQVSDNRDRLDIVSFMVAIINNHWCRLEICSQLSGEELSAHSFLVHARQLSLHLHPIHLTNNQNYMRFIPYTTVTTSVLFQYLLVRVSCNFPFNNVRRLIIKW